MTVLVLANLVSLYLASSVLRAPQGPWDEGGLTAIEVGSMCLILVGAVALLVAAAAVRRRLLGLWWPAIPAVFVVLGVARLTYIVQNYPQPNGP